VESPLYTTQSVSQAGSGMAKLLELFLSYIFYCDDVSVYPHYTPYNNFRLYFLEGARLVPKLVTLNDLKRRNGHFLRYFAEFSSFRGHTYKKLIRR